jgi:preprotein translocase subunit SecF
VNGSDGFGAMEIFKNTNFDFLGKKWPFIIASLILTVAGFGSIIAKGGLRFGIDFREGTAMTVQFASAPPLDKVRSAMSQSMKGEISVQNFTGAARNQVEISTEIIDKKNPQAGRQIMESVLRTAFGGVVSEKPDFNNAGKEELARQLRDPLAQNGVALSDQQLVQLVGDLKQYAAKNLSGVVTSFDQLSGASGANPAVIKTLKDTCSLAPYAIVRTEMVGPKVGSDLRRKAVMATLYALAGMLVYIGFRFEWIYGLGAVIACFHDTIITVGLFSLFDKEISMTVIAALLTLVGYSMNDTIVIFDRIRENVKFQRREPLAVVMNHAINQTLSRTVMTSGLTFLTVIALFIWGGPVLHGFSFALVCGIIVGTYSSVFVASPIVLFWHNFVDRRKQVTAGTKK